MNTIIGVIEIFVILARYVKDSLFRDYLHGREQHLKLVVLVI
jgi:hypothetical protein